MKVKQTPIAAASLALLGMSLAAQAQQAEAPAAEAQAQQLEQVVVTGIRASLQSAAVVKKNANAVVDAVSAEDVGKLPDSDVGQALGRIPGVSVGRSFGQGAAVSIRGSDPQMTYTTLNGQSVASTGWYDQMDIDRSFNYSLLPPELIGGMEVYKSSQANLTEGGIGGTVIVKTRKPLDLDPNTVFLSAHYSRSTISDPEKEVSGLYSWRTADRRFGALVAAGISKGDYIRRGVEVDDGWWEPGGSMIAPSTFAQERKRTSVNVALQARPVEGLELGLNLLKMKLNADASNTGNYIFHDGFGTSTCDKRSPAKSGFSPDGICVHSTITAANESGNAFLQVWARGASMTSDSVVADAHYRLGNAKFDFVLGNTKAKGGTNLTTNYSIGSWTDGASLPMWRGTVDATGKQMVLAPSADPSITMANLPTTLVPETWASSQGPNKDKEKFGQFDATFNLDWGVISAFKAGARLADHTFEKRSFRPVWNTTITPADASKLFGGTIGVASWTVPRANVGAMLENTNQNISAWVEDRSGYGELNEKNRSAYGMFEFDTEGVRGNFGLRYISTKITSTGYKFDGTTPADAYSGNQNWAKTTASTATTYNDVLPSINVAFDLSRNLVLRATASQAITRPNFANMFGVTVSGYNDLNPGNETWTVGNVGLKPMKSSQADLGLEYYYGKGNLLSATYFTKDISNFVVAQVTPDQQVGLVDPNSGVDSWALQSYVNAGGGTIRGLELQANHGFGNGFGVIANYTFTEGKAPGSSYLDALSLFTQASKHNLNLVGYYETEAYFARAAYNWRSKYMIREGAYWYGNRMHDAYGSLDLSFGWNINKSLKLSLDVTNLLKADDIQYGAAAADNTAVKASLRAGYPAWGFDGERTVRLGLSAKF